MADLWIQQIKNDIAGTLRHQDIHKKFIGIYKLQDAWRTASQNEDFDGQASRVWHLINADPDDRRLLVLASILIYIEWNDWQHFAETFANNSGKACYELPLDQKTARRLLGSKDVNFLDSQAIFLPETIEEGKNMKFSGWARLPFEEKDCVTSRGVSGTVKKIVVERGYFKDKHMYVHTQVSRL
jgi:hypothetical protein